MLLPQHFEQKIGFTTLREQLEANCLSALGRRYVARMEFQPRHEPLLKLLRQADELTANLRRLDPADPVKYEFVVFGGGGKVMLSSLQIFRKQPVKPR